MLGCRFGVGAVLGVSSLGIGVFRNECPSYEASVPLGCRSVVEVRVQVHDWR